MNYYLVNKSLNKKLQEISYVDRYPKGFQAFMKKYPKGKSGYYVQFTHKDSVEEKGFIAEPNHRDPAGNYAYPLAYVVKYPSDVWYGAEAPYLRVIKIKPECRVLKLSDLTYYSAIDLLQKAGIRDASSNWDTAQKLSKNRIKGKNKEAKTFWQLLQFDYKTNTVRSPVEQRSLLLKMGYDAVEDNSKSDSSAIINDREPEQILFLNRKFDVVEIFPLNINKGKDGHPVGTTSDYSKPEFIRKIASLIFSNTEDKITSDSELRDWSKHTLWSQKGRKIEIVIRFPSNFTKRELGQKLHREYEKFDNFHIFINYETEHGKIKASSKAYEEIKDLVVEVVNKYEKIKDQIDPNFVPETKQQYVDKEKASTEEVYRKEQEKEISQMRSRIEDLITERFPKIEEELKINIVDPETLRDISDRNIQYWSRVFFSEILEKDIKDYAEQLLEWSKDEDFSPKERNDYTIMFNFIKNNFRLLQLGKEANKNRRQTDPNWFFHSLLEVHENNV